MRDKNHKKQIGFLKNRWTWAIITFLLFLGLGIGAKLGGSNFFGDQAVKNFIDQLGNLNSGGAFYVISILELLAHWGIILPVGLIIILVWIFCYRRRNGLLLLFTAIISTLLTSEVFKSLFHRFRPIPGWACVVDGGYSFPSGHALIAVVFYGLLCYFLTLVWNKKSEKIILWILASLLILLIGWSRIRFGVNWMSDVVGGWSLGVSLLISFISLSQKWRKDKVKSNI